jgi:hypothetical protein
VPISSKTAPNLRHVSGICQCVRFVVTMKSHPRALSKHRKYSGDSVRFDWRMRALGLASLARASSEGTTAKCRSVQKLAAHHRHDNDSGLLGVTRDFVS